jgi:RimJ/RimL family protein N-acetyltransferase
LNAFRSATRLRPTRPDDLPFVTALERHPDNSSLIGQWIDEQHLAAIEGRDRWSHWIIEEANVPAGYIISRDCRAQRAGIYIKRLLVARKERGTGTRALGEFLDHAFDAERADCVWLVVRNENDRAQAVYRKLGFERFDAAGEEAERFEAVAEAPPDQCFRMRAVNA